MVHSRVEGKRLLQQFKREKYHFDFFDLGLEEYIGRIDVVCELVEEMINDE